MKGTWMRKMHLFHKYKYWAILGIVLLAVFCISKTAMAAPETGSISLSYVVEATDFQLYKVGSLNKDNNLVLTGDFGNYPVNLKSMGVEQTLQAYAYRDQLEPIAEASTNDEGKLQFDNLEFAVYLLCGERMEQDGIRYTPAPVLVYLYTDNGGIVNVIIKYEVKNMSEIQPLDLAVLKIWDDTGKESSRPSEITVQLLKNGSIYESVNLNADNDWKYQWTGLNDDFVWMVTEQNIPDGYLLSMEKNGSAYILTNTKEEVISGDNQGEQKPEDGEEVKDPEDGEESKDTEDKKENAGSKNDENSEETKAENGIHSDEENIETEGASSSDNEKLPQTGPLWWPVLLLFCLGLLFVIIGLLFNRMETE